MEMILHGSYLISLLHFLILKTHECKLFDAQWSCYWVCWGVWVCVGVSFCISLRKSGCLHLVVERALKLGSFVCLQFFVLKRNAFFYYYYLFIGKMAVVHSSPVWIYFLPYLLQELNHLLFRGDYLTCYKMVSTK